jgi:hypothetical protein
MSTKEWPLVSRILAEEGAHWSDTYIEGAFGLAKELHCLRRTRFKGKWRVQIQLWLTAAAMNINKAVRSTAWRPREAGPNLLLASFRAFLSLARPISPRALLTLKPLGNSPTGLCCPR